MTKNRKLIIIIIAAILIIAASLLFAIYQGILPSFGGNSGEVVYVQKVSSVISHNVTVDRYGGIIESQKAITYKRDPERKVETVFVKVGDLVTKGTVLFKYDVRSSENSIASIQLDIEGLNNEISYLQGQGNSTEIQLQISERQLEIRQKQADLKKYQQEIEQSEVKSEISGVIKAISETGQDANGNEQPVITMSETGEFRVKGKVSEQSIATLSMGMPVIIRSRVNEEETWTGTISKIETEPASESQEGGYVYYDGNSGDKSTSYPFYVTLDSTAGLMLGQHVYIEPDYGQSQVKPKEGLWIDMSFIAYEDDGETPYVWVARNGRLTKRVLGLGEMDDFDYTVEIVSGLTEDDLIAWPDETLTEGMRAEDVAEVEEG